MSEPRGPTGGRKLLAGIDVMDGPALVGSDALYMTGGAHVQRHSTHSFGLQVEGKGSLSMVAKITSCLSTAIIAGSVHVHGRGRGSIAMLMKCICCYGNAAS